MPTSVLASRLSMSLVSSVSSRDLALVLGVDRVELLVDALQLLVGALQLLVRGEQLLVRGLQLLVAGLELLDRRLQVLLRVAELGLERAELLARDLVERRSPPRPAATAGAASARVERDEQVRRAPPLRLEHAAHGEPVDGLLALRLDAHALVDDRRRLAERALAGRRPAPSSARASTSSSTSRPWRPSRSRRKRLAPPNAWTSSPRSFTSRLGGMTSSSSAS